MSKRKSLQIWVIFFPLLFPGNENIDKDGQGTGRSREASVHRTRTKDAYSLSCSDQGSQEVRVWGSPWVPTTIYGKAFKADISSQGLDQGEGAVPAFYAPESREFLKFCALDTLLASP